MHFNVVIIYYLSTAVPSSGFIKSGCSVLGRYCGPSSRVCFSRVSNVRDRGRFSTPFFLVSFPFDKMLFPAAARFRRLLLLMLLINRLACPFVFVVGAALDVPSGLALGFEQQLSSPRRLGHEMFLCGARSSSTVGRWPVVLDMVVICFGLFILRIYCARSTGKQCWPDGCTCTIVCCCSLIGPQIVFLVIAWWRRKCRSFCRRGVVRPRGRRKDGHVISFRFFQTSSSTDARRKLE